MYAHISGPVLNNLPLSIAGYSSFFVFFKLGSLVWFICFSGSFLFSFNAKMFPTELIILGANQRMMPTAAFVSLHPGILKFSAFSLV